MITTIWILGMLPSFVFFAVLFRKDSQEGRRKGAWIYAALVFATLWPFGLLAVLSLKLNPFNDD